VASFLPDFARNNHGNLAEQQRVVGPQRGADTTRPPAPSPAAAAAAAARAMAPRATAAGVDATALALAQKHTCTACHGAEARIVGPGFREIAARYAGRNDAETYLAAKIRSGGQGTWGAIPMPAQTLPEADAKAIAQWLATGAGK
jgi:cytochrome c